MTETSIDYSLLPDWLVSNLEDAYIERLLNDPKRRRDAIIHGTSGAKGLPYRQLVDHFRTHGRPEHLPNSFQDATLSLRVFEECQESPGTMPKSLREALITALADFLDRSDGDEVGEFAVEGFEGLASWSGKELLNWFEDLASKHDVDDDQRVTIEMAMTVWRDTLGPEVTEDAA